MVLCCCVEVAQNIVLTKLMVETLYVHVLETRSVMAGLCDTTALGEIRQERCQFED